jgi:hypothetical protein
MTRRNGSRRRQRRRPRRSTEYRVLVRGVSGGTWHTRTFTQQEAADFVARLLHGAYRIEQRRTSAWQAINLHATSHRHGVEYRLRFDADTVSEPLTRREVASLVDEHPNATSVVELRSVTPWEGGPMLRNRVIVELADDPIDNVTTPGAHREGAGD